MLIDGDLSGKVIGAAIAVHKELGPGLLERVYEEALACEFSIQGIPFERQVDVPLCYRGYQLDADMRLDFVVGKSLVVELKAVEKLLPVHDAQLLSYLKLTGLHTGLLINFNVPVLRDGINRLRCD